VFEPTGSQRDAASTIFNLSDYRVIDAFEVPGRARRVEVEPTSPPGCPACGVISVRVHSRRLQRIRDVPVAGALEVVWCKRRWFCDEQRCGRGTFAESTLQVPPRARSTVRLRAQLVAAVIDSERAVSETARVRTHVELDVLRGALDEMRASLHETAVFSAADVQFHEIVMAISGNRLAESIARVLFERARDSARYRGNVPLSFHEQTLREHEQVFAAIEAGTIDAAGQAMNAHIIDSWQRRRPPDHQGKTPRR